MRVEGYSILLVNPRLSFNAEKLDEDLITPIKFVCSIGIAFDLRQQSISWRGAILMIS